MPDILLINSPIFRVNRDPDSSNSVPPLGLGYIYTQLVLAGYECEFIDAVADNILPEEITNVITGSNAQYVAANVFSSNLDIVKAFVTKVSLPKTFILGGPAVHALIPEIQRWNTPNKIIVIAGEAELIIPVVLKNPKRWKSIDDSANVQVVRVTPKSPFFPSSIDLPLDRSIFRNEPIIRSDLGLIESHIIASRGCLYNCAFCSAASSHNQYWKPRYRSYSSLNKEIRQIRITQQAANCIRVLDDLFLRDQASIELAIKLFSENDLLWRSMAHVNTFRTLPSRWLNAIMQSGCRELFVGIESGSDEILRRIRKPFSADTANKTIKRILDAQIPLKCYFILGFPGETLLNVKDTLYLASQLSDYARQVNTPLRLSVFRFRPYHGTSLYDELVQRGKIVESITNRIDLSKSNTVNPYDCISGVYSEYDEDTLNRFIQEMEKLND